MTPIVGALQLEMATLSEEPVLASAGKNFRSSYYKSLGFRGEEKNLSQLEGLIKADPIDLDELRAFCLKYALASCYRSTVWRVLTGVTPVYTDKETCSFVREEKRQQYEDLKRALSVMGRIDNQISQRRKPSTDHLMHHPPSSQASHLSPSSNIHSSNLQITSSRYTLIGQSKPETFGQVSKKAHQSSVPSIASGCGGRLAHYLVPENMVLMYLLENNKLLLSSVNQMKQEAQVNLSAIAGAVLDLFEECESDTYWLFSGFARVWETKLIHIDKMKDCVTRLLKEADPSLYSHLKNTSAFTDGIPYNKWFGQCFARDLSEPQLKSVWDKVMAGSSMVVVFVAVAILLSAKRQLLCVRMVRDIRFILESIPKDNLPSIVSHAIEMWESSGSPLDPASI